MTFPDTGIQDWVPAASLATLLEGSAPAPRPGESAAFVELAVLAGRLLRSRATLTGVRREVRLAVPRLLGTPERLDALVDAAWSDAEAADSLCEALEAALEDDTAAALVDLRDDLESLLRVASVAALAADESAPPAASAAHASLLQLAERVDAAAERVMPTLLGWSARGATGRPWMLECIEPPNPWWLDLVDPVMRGARSRTPAPVRVVAGVFAQAGGLAGTADGRDTALVLTSPDDAALELKARHAPDGGFVVTLVRPPKDASSEEPFILAWELEGKPPALAELTRDPVFDLHEAAVPASFGRATAISLAQGGRAWELVAKGWPR